MATETYSLRSGAPEVEAERLNNGHDMLYAVTGDLLPSSISLDLSKPIQVADIGTGTGAWLKQLSALLDPSSTLHGFDIASAQFTPPAALPANVTLHLHNALDPFPTPLHNQYDLVHARLLKYAFRAQDWAPLIVALTGLLKPGGYLFWEDTSDDTWTMVPASEAYARFLRVDQASSIAAGRDLRFATKLAGWFGEAGLEVCEKRLYSSFDVGELDEVAGRLMLRLHEQSLAGTLERGGVEGCMAREEADALLQGIREDVRSGGQLGFGMRRVVGRKSVGERSGA